MHTLGNAQRTFRWGGDQRDHLVSRFSIFSGHGEGVIGHPFEQNLRGCENTNIDKTKGRAAQVEEAVIVPEGTS